MDKISHTSLKRRLSAILLLIIFLFLLLGGRLFYVQVINGYQLRSLAFDQWTRDLPFIADRGDIVDCNGIKLAVSSTSYTLFARPNELKDSAAAADAVYKLLGMDYEKLKAKLSKKGVSEITVKRGLDKNTMSAVSELGIDGFYFSADSKRYYNYGNFLTQVLGFTNIDNVGQSGVEQYYDKYLKGVDGASFTETDIIGRKLDGSVTTYLPPIKGLQANLTIDYYIQGFAEKAVNDALLKYSPKSASCLVMSAKTGAVVAMASAPTYDLNELPRDDMDALLAGSRNGLVNDVYEPGSTFKILTSAIGLETNSIKQSYYCGGGSVVDGQRIRCWRSIGHGSQTFEQGIHNSCNCVFMDIALTAGTQKMYSYFDKFGLGGKTGIDVSGEASGILLKEQNVKNVDIARIGFGQAIAVTPVQLVSAVCSVLNGGYLYRPYVLSSFNAEDGTLAFRNEPNVRNRTVSPATSETMKKYLYGVVTDGGGRNAYVPGYNIGGKTGTAQKYINGSIASGKYISSFLGFTDVGDDTLVCLMLVDEPQGYAYYGSIVAAPLVGQLFSSVFSYKSVAPIYDEKAAELNKTITMPDLMDMDVASACALLKSLGLEYEFTGESGKVAYQLPAAGAEIKKSTVAFFACG